MRTEKQVISQILDFANNNERVRAVILNGSRVDLNAPKDIMQDYDVVFFINSIEDESFKVNKEWIKRFGKLVIMQQNDFADGYIFLMQFQDGVRIDLRFCDIKKINQVIKEDTLTKILLDKDNLVGNLPSPNDSVYHVKKPTEEEYDKLLNESWWIQTYVAKGIWRDELPYAKYMFDVILIACIRKLVTWYLGLQYEWEINVGKCGKWFKRFLPEELYNEFISIYPGVDYDEMWGSLFEAGNFIRKIGIKIAEKLEYTYPIQDDKNVTEYLQRVKALPKDAIDF